MLLGSGLDSSGSGQRTREHGKYTPGSIKAEEFD